MKRSYQDIAIVAGVYSSAAFQDLFEAARSFARGTDVWAEVQPGYYAFHFADHDAYLNFCVHVGEKGHTVRRTPPPAVKLKLSDKLTACRKLVRDDGFEVQVALHAVKPLLQDALRHMKIDHLVAFGTFLRRSITRYLALALCRLLEKPNEQGKTGVTASISSLLEMLKSESILTSAKIDELTVRFEKIKSDSAEGEYDLVGSLRDMRNIQMAHSLIPHKDPSRRRAPNLVSGLPGVAVGHKLAQTISTSRS